MSESATNFDSLLMAWNSNNVFKPMNNFIFLISRYLLFSFEYAIFPFFWLICIIYKLKASYAEYGKDKISFDTIFSIYKYSMSFSLSKFRYKLLVWKIKIFLMKLKNISFSPLKIELSTNNW